MTLHRYLIRGTTIDGPAYAAGAEVEVRLRATVVDDRVVDDDGVMHPRRALLISDWAWTLEPRAGEVPCPTCDGDGKLEVRVPQGAAPPVRCGECTGTGVISAAAARGAE